MGLNFCDRLRLIGHVLRWRLTWSRRDLDFLPKDARSPKFITARQAAELIPDGACVFSSGIAGNARCSVFFYAIRERFQKTSHPNNLTWMNGGAQGGRGKVPGTLEELGLKRLVRRYIAGHLETVKTELKMAEEGLIELDTLPQGVISLLLEEQAKGNDSLLTRVGVGTFLDPRVGRGSAVSPEASNDFVRAEGDGLRYTMPKVEFALFNAPYADAEGNIYFKNAASITEDVQSLKAAHANGGKVLVTVSSIVPKDEAAISLKAAEVDYIVVHPWNEQTTSILQTRYWPMFAPGANADARKAIQELKFINTLLKITPVRGEMGDIMARLATALFAQVVPKGAMVNIGVGFPEEVARTLVEQHLDQDILFTTEAGAYGGLPAPGIFFGAAINPLHLETSSAMFRRYQTDLDVAILGFLQVDSAGNVNVSKRGPMLHDYVGPGGFPDITDGAHTLIFIGNWMANAAFDVRDGAVRMRNPGTPKFVAAVDEITLSGQEALRRGKKLYYVTNVGIFRLTERGVELALVLPGIDVEHDILSQTQARIVLPQSGLVPVASPDFFDRSKFHVQWGNALLPQADTPLLTASPSHPR